MKRILLPYDGSDGSERALDHLIRTPWPHEMEAIVLGVADVWWPPQGKMEVPDEAALPDSVRRARQRSQEATDRCARLVEQAARQIRTRFPHWKVQAVVATGPPAGTIARHAERWDADLILMSPRTRPAWRRFLSGSTAATVSRLTSRPVQVIDPMPARQAAPSRPSTCCYSALYP